MMRICVVLVLVFMLVSCATVKQASIERVVETRTAHEIWGERGYKDFGSYLPGPPVKETGDYGWLPEEER